MSVTDVLTAVRQIAEEAGVDHVDLATLPPRVQVSAIQDRIARRVLAAQEEMLGITHKRIQRIAA